MQESVNEISALGATTNICEKYVKNEGEETEEIEKIEGDQKLKTSDDKEINDFSMVLERELKTECIALAESNTGMLSGKNLNQLAYMSLIQFPTVLINARYSTDKFLKNHC